jgi:hypothetical protein
MIDRRIREFNLLPPERKNRRIRLLRELLRMEAVKLIVIYGRACYYPSLKRLVEQPSVHANASPQYVEAFTSTGKEKKGFVAINEPVSDGTLEHERIPLGDIALGMDQLLVGIEADHFLLSMTIKANG